MTVKHATLGYCDLGYLHMRNSHILDNVNNQIFTCLRKDEEKKKIFGFLA